MRQGWSTPDYRLLALVAPQLLDKPAARVHSGNALVLPSTKPLCDERSREEQIQITDLSI
jgi:hypothetical protein